MDRGRWLSLQIAHKKDATRLGNGNVGRDKILLRCEINEDFARNVGTGNELKNGRYLNGIQMFVSTERR